MKAPRWLLVVEITCWVIGLVGLAGWGAFHFRSVTSTQQSLERFATLKSIALPAGAPDQSLWSPKRVSAWHKALADPSPAPLAVLRIPKIRLEAPVLPGTDDGTLDRAVGHIEGTAKPGTEGNSGLAGHRDGFFRGLKDIVPGDVIELRDELLLLVTTRPVQVPELRLNQPLHRFAIDFENLVGLDLGRLGLALSIQLIFYLAGDVGVIARLLLILEVFISNDLK